MHYECAVFRKVVLIGLSSILIPGCKTQDYIPPIATTVVGAAICNQIYKGKNRSAVTALCAAGGAWVGVKLSQYLNDREKEQLKSATHTTLDTGKTQTVKTETGTTIQTAIVTAPPAKKSTPATQSTPAPKTTPPAQEKNQPPTATVDDCKEVKQTIITSDNQRYEETINACKKGETWIVA